MTIKDMDKTKGSLTKDEITSAAYALILEQGYHGTSMRQIASSTGIALGSIYNHFASKEQLFREIVLTFHPYHEMIPALEAARGETIEELFRSAIKNLQPILLERQDIFNLMFIEMVEFKGKHVSEIFEMVIPSMSNFIQRIMAANGNLRDIPAPMLLRSFISSMLGFMLTERLLGDHMPKDWRVQSLDHMAEIYLFGIINS